MKKNSNRCFSSTIQDLILLLGGGENITKIDNCLSRIRITIRDMSLCADDIFFLNLGASGIVRKNQEIQLIFGPQSIPLRQNLEHFKGILEDRGIILLLQQLQGPDNIRNIEIINSILVFQLHNHKKIPEYTSPFFTLKTQEHSSDVNVLWNNQHEPAQHILNRIQAATDFWDFITARSIFDILAQEEILSIKNNISGVLIEIDNLEITILNKLKDTRLNFIADPEEQTVCIIYPQPLVLKEILIKILNATKNKK